MTRSFTTLLARIVDANAPLPVGDLCQLSDMSASSASTLGEAWSTIEVQRRREVMRHLTEICQTNFEVDFIPVALLGIQDDDSQVRLAALGAFWDAESPELVAPLLQLAHDDPEMMVQAGAAQALGQFVLVGELGRFSRSILGQLTKELLAVYRDTEKALLVRCRALEALAAADLSELPALIQDAYQSEEEVLKISAVSAMGFTADPRWEPVILAELSHVSPSMRYHAAQSAGKLELRTAAPHIIELLEDPDPAVMAASIRSLGKIGGEGARAALELLLDDEEIGGLAQDALEMMSLTDGMPPILLYDMEL